MASDEEGRKRGGSRGPTRRTLAARAAHDLAVAYLREKIPNAFQYDAHALLCAVYMDPRFPIGRRIDAAKAALPYEKPSLASIKQEITGPDGGALSIPTLLIAPFAPPEEKEPPGDEERSSHPDPSGVR